MSIYAQRIAQGFLELAPSRETFYKIVTTNCAAAMLAGEVTDSKSRREFNAEIKDSTGSEYDRNPLSMAWSALFYFGEQLAIAWANGEGASLRAAYDRVPKSGKARKTLLQRVQIACKSASLAELREVEQYVARRIVSMETAQNRATAEAEEREKVLLELIA